LDIFRQKMNIVCALCSEHCLASDDRDWVKE
jgi:hypothetical protein